MYVVHVCGACMCACGMFMELNDHPLEYVRLRKNMVDVRMTV